MLKPPENEGAGPICQDRKPARGVLLNYCNSDHTTEIHVSLQVARLLRRFPLSMPVAALVAELAFGVAP